MKPDFLKDRLAPGQCSRCEKHKIITVKFYNEVICKTCLDDISEEIGQRVADELGGVEEPQYEHKGIGVEIPPMITDKMQKAFEPEKPKKKRGRPPKKVEGQSSFSEDELKQMGEGAVPAEPLGSDTGRPVIGNLPGVKVNWGTPDG